MKNDNIYAVLRGAWALFSVSQTESYRQWRPKESIETASAQKTIKNTIIINRNIFIVIEKYNVNPLFFHFYRRPQNH